MPWSNMRSMQAVLDQAAAPTAFAMVLLVTAGVVALALGGIALLASWLPARRAARVDPIVALRAE